VSIDRRCLVSYVWDATHQFCNWNLWFDLLYVRVSTITAILTVGHRIESTPTNGLRLWNSLPYAVNGEAASQHQFLRQLKERLFQRVFGFIRRLCIIVLIWQWIYGAVIQIQWLNDCSQLTIISLVVTHPSTDRGRRASTSVKVPLSYSVSRHVKPEIVYVELQDTVKYEIIVR